VTLALHGGLDRTLFQNATLADGTVDKLSADDFNDWSLRARAGYRLSGHHPVRGRRDRRATL
jgi:hypothetical protein